MSWNPNLARVVRRRAASLGLAVVQRGSCFTLFSGDSQLVSGDLSVVEAYVAARYEGRRPGPAPLTTPSEWQSWIALFVREQKSARRSAGSIRLRVAHLAQLARRHPEMGPLTVTRDDLVGYMAEHAQEWTPRTAHSVRTSLRVFFGLIYDLGHRPDNPASRLASIRVPRSVPRPCPDYVIERAYRTVRDDAVRLAIRVAVETGMRRGEIARLRPADVIGQPGNYSLFVVGKGGHERTVPIADDLAEMIIAVPTDYVFTRRDGTQMTSDRLGLLMSQALPGEWTAHTLRHRFATMAYQVDTDLRAVQELLGHASPTTTAIYTKVPDNAMRRAAGAARINPAARRELVREPKR